MPSSTNIRRMCQSSCALEHKWSKQLARPIFLPGMRNAVSEIPATYDLVATDLSFQSDACTLWRDMYGIATDHCKQFWCLGSDLWLYGSLH